MILIGAFAAVAVVTFTGSPWLGVLGAAAAGGLFALVHAFASITLRTDQVVSGTAINILATGVTGFLMQVIYGRPGSTNPVARLTPLLNLPTGGEGFFAEVWRWIDVVFLSHTPLVYFAIALAIVGHWWMKRTTWGLRLRALGEHPRAADTVGINVVRGRYYAVLMSGVLAGLAGANLALEQVGSFTEGMSRGRGFIALAANIFGGWTPGGSYLASLLFGFAEALQFKLQPLRDVIHIPAEFFMMLPYILTIVVLAGVVRRAVAPAAVGVPYEKG
jgi:simple sugar transport system permease protein